MEQEKPTDQDEFIEVVNKLYETNSSLMNLFFKKKINFHEYSDAFNHLQSIMKFIEEKEKTK